jgi:hypothetical protein
MRSGLVWTQALDEQLREMRVAGMTWDGIAAALALGRNSVLERARKIGARVPRQVVRLVEEEPRDRPARPAGHPQTWGLITDGTVLDGERYPFPVFI